MDVPSGYPFTAVVGQRRLKLALMLAVINPALGGVLIRGGKGTGKSTAVRGLVGLLPDIEVVRGCAYGCDPTESVPCDDCRTRRSLGPLLDRARRQIPFVNLPVGATADRVLGSLDIDRTQLEGLQRFAPGLLAEANRGILYVDEVNLLDGYLSATILDAAAMGLNYVEREGFSITHPARFMLIGTMNPEEGELRPQLRDRFALTIDMEPLTDPAERQEVVCRRIAYDRAPESFVDAWRAAEEQTREQLARARALAPLVVVPDRMLNLMVRICAAFGVDGLRADLALFRASVAHAAYQERTAVVEEDVRVAARLALPHRHWDEVPGRLDRELAEIEDVIAREAAKPESTVGTAV